MKAQWFRRVLVRHTQYSLLLFAAAYASVACGSRVRDSIGGETGFLGACGTDSDCESNLCACGVCTRSCTELEDCGERSVCTASVGGEECVGNAHRVCVLKEDVGETSPTTPTEPQSTSAGRVEIRLEVEGAVCELGCGGHAVSLYKGPQRELIQRNLQRCDAECPPAPTLECEAVATEAFTWDGRIALANGSLDCESEGSGNIACDTEVKYLPPGRYSATACLGRLDALGCEENCFTVDFEFPASEPVVIRWVNDSTNGAPTSEPGPTDAPTDTNDSTNEPGPTDAPTGTNDSTSEPGPTDAPTDTNDSTNGDAGALTMADAGGAP